MGNQTKEIDELVESCIKEGQVWGAIEIAKFGGKKLTAEEIKQLTEIIKGRSERDDRK